MTEPKPTDADQWREDQKLFNAYCAKLCALIDVTTPGGFGNVVSRAQDCACGRRIPAGIPTEYRGSMWCVCPPCIRAKQLLQSLDRKLEELYPDVGPEVMSIAKAMVHPKGERFDPRAARIPEKP